jgi:hypothetical protein
MTTGSLKRFVGFAVSIALWLAACQGSPTGSAVGPSALSTTVPATPLPTTPVAFPAVGRLVFDRFDSNQNDAWLGTFVIGAGPGDNRPLTVPVKAGGHLAAVWSPDGRRILLNVWTPPSGPARPAIMNADGTSFRSIDPKGIVGDLGCSAWSPDGSSLLCSIVTADPATAGIYSIRSDGTHLTRLTISPYRDTVGASGECGGGDTRGVFSPDGKEFAFIRQKCGTGADPSSDESGAILIASADGTGLHEIVPQGGVRTHEGSALSWSPDGSWIAFGTQDQYLSLIHPDGTGLVKPFVDVGNAPINAVFGPSWSPDGNWIVFGTVFQGVAGSLYMVMPDGSNLTQVQGDTKGAAFVNWGPAASP